MQERFSSAMTLAWAHYEREFLRAMAERSVAPAKAQDVVRGIFNDAVCMHACLARWVLVTWVGIEARGLGRAGQQN